MEFIYALQTKPAIIAQAARATTAPVFPYCHAVQRIFGSDRYILLIIQALGMSGATPDGCTSSVTRFSTSRPAGELEQASTPR